MSNTLTLPPQTTDTAARTAEMEARAEVVRRFSDTDLMMKLIRKGARAAKIDHKRNGVPIVTSVDGKVVIIQPEDIVIPDEED